MEITSFDELNLPEALNHTLAHMNFKEPTPIQAQAIPYALAGKDILGSAQTGTGKTGAFGIPLVARLLSSSRGTALVMAPTRELAAQVMEQLEVMLGKRSKIKAALLIGGDSMPKQMQQLRNRPRLLVGTPGRINDHLERGSLMLHDTSFLVLDETDRMLDMGFSVQIEKILKFMPQTRQTMLFSATLPKDIIKIANTYLNDPVRVAVSATSQQADNIDHEVVHVERGEKHKFLLKELDAREGSVIIFVKTKHGTEKLADQINRSGHHAVAIHGDLRQSKRDRVIANFRDMKNRILVATDVAARGLDIPHIEHVINFDLPQAAEDYIHRIGRTARAGAKGHAMCMVTSEDRGKWKAIARLMNIKDEGGSNDDAGEERSARSDRPRSNGRGRPQGGGRRSYGDKPKGDKPRGERSDRPRSDKPRREDSDRPRSDRPRREDSDRPRSDRPRGERSDRPRSDKPRGERSDRPRSDRPRREDSDRPRSDKPRGERSDRPRSDRPRREDSDRPRSDKPRGERSDRPRSDKPRSGGKPSGKPQGGRGKPAGKPTGKAGGKPQGRKSGGSQAPSRKTFGGGAKRSGGKGQR